MAYCGSVAIFPRRAFPFLQYPFYLPLFPISIKVKYSSLFTCPVLAKLTVRYGTVPHHTVQCAMQTYNQITNQKRVISCDSIMPRGLPKRHTATLCPPPAGVLFGPFPLPDPTESRFCGGCPAHTQDGEWGTPVALRISLVFGYLF